MKQTQERHNSDYQILIMYININYQIMYIIINYH